MWRRFTLWKTILESAASQQLEILFGSRSVLETRMCSEVLRASASPALQVLCSAQEAESGQDSRAGDSAVRV